MIAVNNLPLGDTYTEANKWVSLSAQIVTLQVFNNPVAIQILKRNPRGGQDYEYMPEQVLAPGFMTITNAVGLRAKNAVTGQIARIYLAIPEADAKDPEPGIAGYVPTTLTVTAAGSLGSVGVIDRIIAATDINGVNTEQTLYNYNFTAGQIAANGIVEGRFAGHYLHNNLAGDTLRFRLYFGLTSGALTAIYDVTDSLGGTLSGVRHPWDLYFRLQNRGIANSQQWQGNLDVDPTTGTAPTVGIGNLAQAAGSWKNPPIGLGPGAYAFDTTQACTFRITVQWSVASANDSFVLANGFLTNN